MKISATASMGLKLKIFSDFENVSPHISLTVDEELPDSSTLDERVDAAVFLYQKLRKRVEEEMEKDIEFAKKSKKK